MPRRTKRLRVLYEGECLAYLEQRVWPDIRCRYTAEAHGMRPGNSPLLSCSLPLSRRPLDARAFCRGLLPEGPALEFMAREANAPVNDTFALLGRYGRDVAGALTIVPDDGEDAVVDAARLQRYDAAELAREVDELPERPLALHDDSELSLPGLQSKILLVRTEDGGWARPRHGYPSTHILKTDDARFPGLVDAEAACLELAQALGLTSVAPQLIELAATRCLIVSRFDRRRSGAMMPERIHQEDICQALGIDPMAERGRAKYERAGGPGFADVAGLLDAYAAEPVAELGRLVEIMTFTLLIGNADAHGKNLALLHDPLDVITLAPLYDTVPTMLWPKLRREAAMSVGAAAAMERITGADLIREAAAWPFPADAAAARIAGVIRRALEAVEAPGFHAGVAGLVRSRAPQLAPPDG